MYDGDAMVNAQQQNVQDLDRSEVYQILNWLLLQHNPYATLLKAAAQRMMVDKNTKIHLRMLDAKP